MTKETEISASGVENGHPLALDELPAEYIVHPRIVVSRGTGMSILQQTESVEPNEALRKLMRDGD